MSKGLLYGYQNRWFQDRSRFKAGMFARQTGKTFTTTLEVVDDTVEAMTQGKRNLWVLVVQKRLGRRFDLQGAAVIGGC